MSFHIFQVVAFLGILVYNFYGEELREMFGYAEHPYAFYTMAGKFTLKCHRIEIIHVHNFSFVLTHVPIKILLSGELALLSMKMNQ